ncbi:MAG: dTMP kinase [Coriobacteriia bacterium]|nr:dTMP kinase [Coriobacteriia bacterium]
MTEQAMQNEGQGPESQSGLPGTFITFEGGEGVGKTTHIQILAAHLTAAGLDVVCLREPGGTQISEKIRQILLDSQNAEISVRTELLLYEAARAQLVTERILPSLQKGVTVLCDRYLDSTIAYQGYGRGLPLSLVEEANRLGSLGLMPTRTVLLVDDWEQALRRARLQGADRLEAQNLDFHRRVNEGFLELAAQNPKRIRRVFLQDDAQSTADLVFQAVSDLFGEKAMGVYQIPEQLLKDLSV